MKDKIWEQIKTHKLPYIIVASVLVVAAIVIVIVLCCQPKPEPIVEPEPEKEPIVVEPEPETEPEPVIEEDPIPGHEIGYAKAGGVYISYIELARGTEIEVLDVIEADTQEIDESDKEENKYFTAIYEGTKILIEKRFVRLSTEDNPPKWEGYARSGYGVFDSGYLSGDPLKTLEENTKVKVIDVCDVFCYVEVDGTNGYMSIDGVSESEITHPTYSGGGGGSSYTPPAAEPTPAPEPVPAPVEESQDGGEIELAFESENDYFFAFMDTPIVTTLEGSGIKATVLSDKVITYLGITTYGDELMVTKRDEETTEIWMDGVYGTLPSWSIRMETDEPYSQFDGYAVMNAYFYDTPYLENLVLSLDRNTIVKVLDTIPELEIYVVKVAESEDVGYMEVKEVSETEIEVPAYSGGGSSYTPTASEPTPAPSEENTGVTEEGWTEPVL